jgi:hypothetical protein
MPNLNVGAGLIDRRESDEFHSPRTTRWGGGPVHPKARGNAGGKGVVLATAGRLLECAKEWAWRIGKLGQIVSYRHACLVVEASNGDTDRRIRQELAPGIAGARAQGRIVDELERSLRIDRYDVLDAVRRVEDALKEPNRLPFRETMASNP